MSQQETEVVEIFEDYGLEYEYEKTWYGCRDQRVLPFDFYVPQYNLVVECDGIQHFEAQTHFGGEAGYRLQKKHDKIKDDYCKKEGIDIIRIPYFKDTRKGLKKLINKAIKLSLDYGYFINTEGCYVISDCDNVVVCHRCDISDPDTVDLDGEDLHIKYLEGDMALLLNWVTDAVRHIIFERNDTGDLRYYDFEKVKKRVLRNAK